MNDELKKYVKYKISISKIKEEDKIIIKRKMLLNKSIGIVACVCIILTTGIVFAKEIKEFIFNKYRLGPEIAIDNGYIAEYNGNDCKYKAVITKGNKSQDVLTCISLNNFMVSNKAISLDLVIEFSDEINNFIEIYKTKENNLNYEKFYNIEFTDLYIIDEEDNLIYSSYMLPESNNEEEKFNAFCKEYNLDFEYGKFNEKYSPNILNEDIWEYNEEKNKLYISLNIGKGTMIDNEDIPKSKNIQIITNEIKLIPKDIKEREDLNNYITIKGKWKFDIEIPETMYNREEINYKVVSSENSNITVISAKATEIEFNLNLLISNIEEAIIPEECAKINEKIMKENGGEMAYPSTKEEYIKLYGNEELVKEYEKFLIKQRPINYSGEQIIPWEEPNSEGCFIIDKNNKKFNVIPAGCIGNFCYNSEYDENGLTTNTFLNQYEAHINFEMTKYNASDRITVIIELYGKPYKIELEKI